MNSYGQFCPLAQAAQILCERWTLIIVRELIAGSSRFNQLKKGMPLISPTMLSARLKQLETAGVITITGKKGSYHYNLTTAGLELRPMIELLGAWGHRWAPSNLKKGDLDVGLLMWDIRRSVAPEVFPKHRIVVQFEYSDAQKGERDWWLVSENGEIDLCLSNPGHDIDIMIKCSVKTMSGIWIRQQQFRDAVNNEDVKVTGDPKLTSKLQDWLRSSPLARLGSLKEFPKLVWNIG